MVNWVAEETVLVVVAIWQLAPMLPAVMSTHEPEVEEIFAEPDFTDQLTPFVLPLVT